MGRRHKLLSLLLRLGCFAPVCLSASCAAWYRDEVAVPGTNQRIVVGSDNWPTRKAWVLVDGVARPLTIIHEEGK